MQQDDKHIIIYILNDILKWESFSEDDNNNNKTYHWKSIYNEFNKWSHYNIFEDAFNDFIKKFYFKIYQIKNTLPQISNEIFWGDYEAPRGTQMMLKQ